MKFKINGEVPVLDDNPLVGKCLAILDNLPDGELITAPVLARAAGYQFESFANRSYLLPETHSAKRGQRKFYGNQKTIKAWKAQNIQS